MSIIKKISFLLLLLLICSCVSRKEISYFYQSNEDLDSLKIFNLQQSKTEQLLIQPNDQLTITVSAEEQDAAKPFNLPVANGGNIINSAITTSGNGQLQTYIVDNDGYINFPVLGKIRVGEKRRQQLTEELQSRISKYIKNPIVNVRLANFQISVLGEVNAPGTFTINNEYVSLPKALGLAGDMTIYGRRDNVLVMRENNGVLTKAYLDLTENDIINSPFYYLKQNDVIVVEPNGPARQAASYNRNASLYISVASVLISLIVVISR